MAAIYERLKLKCWSTTGSLVPALALAGLLASPACNRTSDPAQPQPVAPSERPAPHSSPPEPKREPLAAARGSAEALRAARDARRIETRKFKNMTADMVLVVVDCEGTRRVPTMVGVLDVPYDHAAGMVAVAEVSAEKALAATKPEPNCVIEEATYWARDEAEAGDWVVRYSSAPESPTAVWWVPDSGAARKSDTSEIPARACAARLLRGASHFAEVAEDMERAASLVSRAIELAPDDPEVAEVRAELMGRIDAAQAVADLRAYLSAHPDAPASLKATLAELLVAKAAAVSEVPADADPEAARATESLRAEARTLVDAVLKTEPTQPKALALRAEWHRDAGQAALAIADYRALLAAHPGLDAARYNLATLLLDNQQSGEGIQELDHYLATYPEDTDALYLRGRAHLGQGALDAAARDVNALRKLAADAPETHQLEMALAAARKAKEP